MCAIFMAWRIYRGVLDKMDYLEQLGVEVIYFNPLFVSPSNHKYTARIMTMWIRTAERS